MTGPPEGDILHVPWHLPGLARRSHRLVATVTAGPSLEVTVHRQGRRYRVQIHDPGTGRTWRCPHRHLACASASQCGGVIARRVNRLGWQRATERQRGPGQHRSGPADRA